MLNRTNPFPKLARCLVALAAITAGACDPGEVCEPRSGIDVPEGVDPCDPSTYPGAEPSGDAGTDVPADGVSGDVPADGVSGDAENPDATDDTTGAAYPAGPYGTNVGSRIAPLEFPTTTGENFSFDGDIFQDESVSLVLVSTAAGWCTACREEQPALVELYEDHHEDGLLVILAIFEDNDSGVVTPEFAQGWVAQYGIPFPALIDEFNDFASFYEPTLAPMNMFFDGETMEIIDITIGALDEPTAAAIIADRL